jgi:hypothetical protein
MLMVARLPRGALLASAGLTFTGSVGALLIAARTHASAPLCGGSHCAACYVAVLLALLGLLSLASSAQPVVAQTDLSQQ